MRSIEKLIIVQHHYSKTTAKTQRMLAAAKEYVRLGVKVVFIVSTGDQSFDNIDGVRFIKIEENRKKMLQCFYHFVSAIKKEYDERTAILFYGVPLYAGLFTKKKYSVFAEETEIPHYGKKVSLAQKFIQGIRYAAARHFSGIMVITKELKDFYTRKGIKYIEVVNMFVDNCRFSLPKNPDRKRYIAYCGSVSYYKDGVDDLIQSFKLVHDIYPEYELKIIGGFEDSVVEKNLRLLVNNNALSNSVNFTGLVNSSEMPQLLKDAEILALARPDNLQAKYGFPTKLGEYLATGNPVVVTKVGEIPEYITDKYNGLLAEPGNPFDFADKLIYLIEHPIEAAKIGLHGKELTMKEFSAKVQIEKALKFILTTA